MVYNVNVTEVYCYQIQFDAQSEKEALEKAKTAYKNNEAEFNGVFVADATTIENTKFKVVKINSGEGKGNESYR